MQPNFVHVRSQTLNVVEQNVHKTFNTAEHLLKRSRTFQRCEQSTNVQTFNVQQNVNNKNVHVRERLNKRSNIFERGEHIFCSQRSTFNNVRER